MFPDSPVLRKSKELYKDFPEVYINNEEWRHHFIQQEFKRSLGLDPKDYGRLEVDMYKLAQERGMVQ
jgi:hypothetical protein